ncbi:MAG TPA: hypothetical protein VHX52_05540 [Steroidobacteraceae bacterium]|jgi:hydrogenase maturation protease|nr:hypothetical protein [Steroidobacteraceae bacterium]
MSDNRARAEQVAATLLYEGYILYPYRASSAKNRSRWTFGSLFPQAFGAEPSRLQVQCLLRANSADAPSEPPQLQVRVRFLHIVQRGSWQQAIEREVTRGPFAFAAGEEGERSWRSLEGEVQVQRDRVAPDTERVSVEVINRSPLAAEAAREQALRSALASTHVILEACGGQFVSLLDPPAELRSAAAACRNEGAWPALIGSEIASDTVLASPIILYDNPGVAPESPGALYDATEIDEILSLRVLAMTAQEKSEAAALDERARALIERTESLSPAEWEAMHGCFRDRVAVKVGERVRIRPRRRADIMDIALAGKIGIIEAIEHDYDRQVHVAVALEDDPGRDLGLERMPGHRFFFAPDELEPLQ